MSIISNPVPPLEVPVVSVPRFLHETLLSYKRDKIIFIDQETGRKLTVGALLDGATRLAAVLLHRLPLSSSDLAIFHAVNSLELIICQLAVSFLGLAYSPVTINCKAFELSRQAADCNATIVFCSSNYAETVSQVIKDAKRNPFKMVVILDGSHDGMVPFSDLVSECGKIEALKEVPHFRIENPKQDIYLIVYTSGSTGLPKGAAHTHFGILSGSLNVSKFNATPFARTERTKIPAGLEDKLLSYFWYPLAHSSGQCMILINYIMGGTAIINGHQTNESVLQAVQDYKLTQLSINPAMGQFMATDPAAAKYDLSSLKQLGTGGCHFPESIARTLMSSLKVIVLEGYGCTEIGFISCREATDPYEAHNVGGPAPGITVKVVDMKTLRTLEAGKEGEIWVKSDACIKGYLNRPDATSEAITQDGWYRSGDIGYINERGQIILCDRIKEMIKFQSSSVYPAEVEHILSLHAAVLESVVVPLPHPIENEHPMAYVKLRPGFVGRNTHQEINCDENTTNVVTDHELIRHVAERLADQKHIRGGVVFWDGDVPRISIGKPDRQFFKQLARKISNNNHYVKE